MTNHKEDLVPDYVREVKWQASDADDFGATVNENGTCISVKYYDGTSLLDPELLDE